MYNMTLRKLIIALAGAVAVFSVQAKISKNTTYSNYIEKYAPIAIVKMQEHGIPASITLAQGVLESGGGQSELAKKSNNHFGIKCGNDWDGDKVYHDDDKKHECFRKYKSAELSFEDHSKFLMKSRYQKLFELDVRDYKGWAKGLKECGYATDANYAKRLIEIIEAYELYNYDKGLVTPIHRDSNNVIAPSPTQHTSSMGYILAYNTHEVSVSGTNKIVKAEQGDTYASIAKEFGLRKWQIRRYNNIGRKDGKEPTVGENVIIGRAKK